MNAGESAPERRATTRRAVIADPTRRARPATKVEFPRETSRTPPFTTTQFHVLLNSLFKVLFNFPSRYLFAIGLGVIFSLTRSLPGTLGCTSKQPDSGEKSARQDGRLTGLSPSTGSGHCQVGLRLAVHAARRLSRTSHSARPMKVCSSTMGCSRFIRHY